MIDMPWSYTLLSFAASFFISWFLFAVFWYCVVLYHGKINIITTVMCGFVLLKKKLFV